jgi:mRNA-degrading endonuclease RelE of RelBE toxin-antitoxin system
MADRPIELAPRAWRDLEGLPGEAAAEILADLQRLRSTPWPGPPKVKKLRGHELFRLRTGDYRSVFEVRGAKVVILRIVSRGDLERILATI